MRLINILKHKICKAWLEGGPGDSVENAVIVHCSDYFAGSRAESKYLEKKCGKFITDWTLDVKILIKREWPKLRPYWHQNERRYKKEVFILMRQK